MSTPAQQERLRKVAPVVDGIAHVIRSAGLTTPEELADRIYGYLLARPGSFTTSELGQLLVDGTIESRPCALIHLPGGGLGFPAGSVTVRRRLVEVREPWRPE